MRAALFMLAVLIQAGCAGPTPSGPAERSAEPAASPTSASDAEGRFVLTFELPRISYATADAIEGLAVLSTTDGRQAGIAGSGGGPLGFVFTEVDGTRQMGAAFNADCAFYTVDPSRPMESAIRKSGGWSGEDPNAAFYQQFFADPQVHLPAGRWDISAIANFAEGTCGGVQHQLSAGLRITVTP